MERLRILVLGDDTRSFLSVVRALGRHGHEIHAAWCTPGTAQSASRYIHRLHPLSLFQPDNDAWLDEFEGLLAANRIDLVIPCSDPAILPLQAMRASIGGKARLYLLPDDVFHTVNSKIEMDRIVRELAIPTAQGRVIESEPDARQALEALPGPWVFKPESSYAHGGDEVRGEVRKAYTKDEALQLVPQFLARGRFQIQTNFIGVGTGVEVLCADGEILLVFQHLRVHEPLHGGGSSYRRAQPVHPAMLAAAKRLMARLEYTGVAMIEFKWNRERDEWIFIELNARFWGSLPLAVASGADFPNALVDLLTHGKRSFPYRIRNDLWARNIELDVEWLIGNARADKHDPTLATLPWSAVLAETWTVLRGHERWDTFALDDPKPFFKEAARVFSTKAKAFVRHVRYSDAYLRVLRHWRRYRLRRLLRRAERIGFVCYGNICRSPFAESYARNGDRRLAFFSAGFHWQAGRPVPAHGLAAAKNFDIDLANHRSVRLSPEEVGAADLLFVFDKKNLMQMRAEFADAIPKTFLLSDLADVERLEIPDPWDRGTEEFNEVYRTIRTCIDAMRQALPKPRS